MLEQVLLSRLQFALTVGFHILWPAYSIGIASFVALLNALWFLTKRPVYRVLLRFWLRLFALGFAMGVVTGVVLSYEIGGNWAEFSRAAGPVLGPLFMYETLTAFFLEAGFLGIALLGERRVGPRLHLVACIAVALGTIFSAFWILAANSWMQTPAGTTLGTDGVFHVTSWWSVIFNPSFPYRLAHMLCACFITGALFVAGVSAVQLRLRRAEEHGRVALSLAIGLLAILAPLQLVIGDLHGLNTREHQPVKLAAIEGRWETASSVPLTVFAIPDQSAEKNHFALELPHLGSLILTHRWDGEVRGLKEVPPADRPNVLIVFFAFRAMVACGLLILMIAAVGSLLRVRGQLYHKRWFHRVLIAATPLGWIAILSGWVVTEVGRQPYVVYGMLRTANAASPTGTTATATTLLLFVLIYALIMAAFLWYWVHMVLQGPGRLSDVPEKSRVMTTPAIIAGSAHSFD